MSADNYGLCPKCKDENYTLREYYGINISKDGKFSAEYFGSCEICDFEFEFNHTIKNVLK